MTRDEFIQQADNWEFLIDWCYDNGCSYCDDIYSDDNRDDRIDEEVSEYIRQERWYDLKRWLDDIPTGYDYWRKDDYGDWYGVDDELDEYLTDILQWADEHSVFEIENDEDSVDEYIIDEEGACDEEFEINPDISLDSLFVSSIEDIKKMENKNKQIELANDANFDKFVATLI